MSLFIIILKRYNPLYNNNNNNNNNSLSDNAPERIFWDMIANIRFSAVHTTVTVKLLLCQTFLSIHILTVTGSKLKSVEGRMSCTEKTLAQSFRKIRQLIQKLLTCQTYTYVVISWACVFTKWSRKIIFLFYKHVVWYGRTKCAIWIFLSNYLHWNSHILCVSYIL
jgi:hypothetical protein